MTTAQLRYFVETARLQSFTKAAERLFITQTAMTQQIRALEMAVGVELFDRSTRPISLTPAGEAFLIDARAILERMDLSLQRVQAASSGLAGTLRIGYLRGFERSNLSNVLCSFHRRFPNVLLSLYRDSTDALAASLIQHQLDLIVTWDSTNLALDKARDSFCLGDTRLVVALYPSHPLAARESLSRKELKDEKILFMSPSDEEDSYGDAAFINLYREAGFKPDMVFRSSDAESVLMMVAMEEGISILPDYCTSKLTNADNLVFIPLEGCEEIEKITALWNQDNSNPVLPHLVNYLQQNYKGGYLS